MTLPDAATHAAAKAGLRQEARGRRRAIAGEVREAAAVAIRDRLLVGPLAGAAVVACFASFGDEIDTRPLMEALAAGHRTVALPLVLHRERRLEFRAVDRFPAGCVPGPFGILQPDPLQCPEIIEPEALEAIVVPGLAFTRDGWRLGYGGGYYDRLLLEAPRAKSAGVAFHGQLVESLPLDPWDRAVGYICTERELIVTGREGGAGLG